MSDERVQVAVKRSTDKGVVVQLVPCSAPPTILHSQESISSVPMRLLNWDSPALFEDLEFCEEFLDTFSSEIAVLDQQGRMVAASKSWRARSRSTDELSGRDATGVDGVLDSLLCDRPTSELIRTKILALLSDSIHDAEVNFAARGGRGSKHYRLRMVAIGSATARHVILANDDVSETYELQRDKRLLTDQLMRSEEKERRRIAREMHDSTVQDLVAIGLNLKRLRHLADDALAQEVLGEVRMILARTQEDVRTLSYLLHPPLLEEGGLVLALASLIQGLSSRMRISVEFETDVSNARLPVEIEMALYRVAQEALINVHKHASATQACVQFTLERDRLVLKVEDDGIGISARQAQHVGSGVGIQGMRARLMQLGGTLTLSTLKHGTRLKAVVPIGESCVD